MGDLYSLKIQNPESKLVEEERSNQNTYISFDYPLTLYMKYLSTLVFGYEMLK